MQKTLLAAQAGADPSEGIWVDDDSTVVLIIYAASGHTASEYSDVQISHDGTSYQDLWIDGEKKRLHSGNVAVRVEGPGYFRVNKGTTTNPTGVFACLRD